MIYGYFTYAVAGIVGFVIALCIGGFFVRKYYFARYSPCGKATNKPYSSADARTAYIPQVKNDAFAFPFLACPVDKIRDCNISYWKDPNRPYDFYDITKDAEQLLIDNGKTVDTTPLAVFSTMIYCQPASETINN